MASRAVHVKIVTSLVLKNLSMAFSRFNDVHGKMKVIYSDKDSTFQAASKALTDLLQSPSSETLSEKRYKVGICTLLRS